MEELMTKLAVLSERVETNRRMSIALWVIDKAIIAYLFTMVQQLVQYID